MENEKPLRQFILRNGTRQKGRKMSKSLGNSPDLALIWLILMVPMVYARRMLLASPAGGDLLFDEKNCASKGAILPTRYGTRFVWFLLAARRKYCLRSKMPNHRLVWEQIATNNTIILSRILPILISGNFKNPLYFYLGRLFCSLFGMVKPPYGEPIGHTNLRKTIFLFRAINENAYLLCLFISEEVFQQLKPLQTSESIMVASWSQRIHRGTIRLLKMAKLSVNLLAQYATCATNRTKTKRYATVWIKPQHRNDMKDFCILCRNARSFSRKWFDDHAPADTVSMRIGKDKFWYKRKVDWCNLPKSKNWREINYLQGFKGCSCQKVVEWAICTRCTTRCSKRATKKDADNKLKVLQRTLGATIKIIHVFARNSLCWLRV